MNLRCDFFEIFPSCVIFFRCFVIVAGMYTLAVIKNPNIMFENKKQTLDLLNEKLNRLIIDKIENLKTKLFQFKNNYILNNPENLYKNKRIELNNLIDKLELINPLNILKRGYTLTYVNDKVKKTVKDIKKNDVIKTKFNDGYIISKVEEIGE